MTPQQPYIVNNLLCGKDTEGYFCVTVSIATYSHTLYLEAEESEREILNKLNAPDNNPNIWFGVLPFLVSSFWTNRNEMENIMKFSLHSDISPLHHRHWVFYFIKCNIAD